MRKCPKIVKMSPLIEIVQSFVEDKYIEKEAGKGPYLKKVSTIEKNLKIGIGISCLPRFCTLYRFWTSLPRVKFPAFPFFHLGNFNFLRLVNGVLQIDIKLVP